MIKNNYGALCTKMYEQLHPKAPQEELEFFLSYAREGQSILEPMCGSGRFLLPFLERGMCVCGMDISEEMLSAFREKAPQARTICADLTSFCTTEAFDYIMIPACSLSLFTDEKQCRQVLLALRRLLRPGGLLLFSVETEANACSGEAETVQVTTEEGDTLLLTSTNRYDTATQTQFSPGIYQLYRNGHLLEQEEMDFQTHLYRPGEMESLLQTMGFETIHLYGSYTKEPAKADSEVYIYECYAPKQQSRTEEKATLPITMQRLRDNGHLMEQAAAWFHQKWGIPLEAYRESMLTCLAGKSAVPQWYLAMEGKRIVGGLGVIENDFHPRKDLAPNVCAVYVEPDFRCRGIAGQLLHIVCEDMAAMGMENLYLLTDHTSFYERYGWQFLCMVQGDGDEKPSRVYVYSTKPNHG